MKDVVRFAGLALVRALFVLLLSAGAMSLHAAEFGAGFQVKRVPVDGATISATVGGSGPPVVLLHGYAETSAMYPQDVEKLALMDAFLPGVAGWEPIYNNPGIWHFRFYGPTPEALVKGRERIFFEHFWSGFAADPKRSIGEADRQAYTRAYSQPGRTAAGFAYLASFPKTATDFAELAKTRLTIPVLSIGGEKSLGEALGAQVRLISPDATVVVLKGSGHWIMEERPAETMDALVKFMR